MPSNKNTEPLKFIDLCCGIGGFHQALANLQMECVFASDIDSACRENYELNYGIEPIGDFTEYPVEDIPNFDILCAGFPCQPFSKAGMQNGFDDERGNIFFDICRIVKHHQPKYLILENVRNLASHDKGNTWLVIKKKLDELGYLTYQKPVILNTLYFGVPQSRERVVIMCLRQDLGVLPTLPSISKANSLETNLASIIEDSSSSTEMGTTDLSPKFEASKRVWNNFLNILGNANIKVPKFPLWTDWWDGDGENTNVTKINPKLTEEENQEIVSHRQKAFLKKYESWIKKNRDFYHQNQTLLQPWLETSRQEPLWRGAVRKLEWQAGDEVLSLDSLLWSPRGSGIRVKSTNYSPTLVAMASMIPIYGPLNRQLTPRECARLMSFPDSYKIHPSNSISYSQFGNAVNVKMIEQVAKFLILGEKLF